MTNKNKKELALHAMDRIHIGLLDHSLDFDDVVIVQRALEQPEPEIVTVEELRELIKREDRQALGYSIIAKLMQKYPNGIKIID